MLWTAVPEAPINKDGNAAAREDDVWPHRQILQADWEMLPEPEPIRVQRRANPQLRS